MLISKRNINRSLEYRKIWYNDITIQGKKYGILKSYNEKGLERITYYLKDNEHGKEKFINNNELISYYYIKDNKEGLSLQYKYRKKIVVCKYFLNNWELSHIF